MKKIALTPSLATFAIFIILLSACGKKGKQKPAEILKPVKYAIVTFSGGIQERNFNGISQSGSEAKLSFRANGLIVAMKVKTGDRVKYGQLLARIDSKDAQLAYEKAKAALENAKIQLETASSGLERIKQLYTSNNASLNDYEQAKSAYANAQSGYQTAKKSLDLQASQLQYTKIKAPTDGIITAVNAEINEFAQAGAPVIVISSKEEDIEINIGVPEIYITKIVLGDMVTVKFPSIKNKSFKGTITEVGYSTAEFVTYPVIVRILEPSKDIRPGMPVDVTFTFGEKSEDAKLAVPVKAVGEDHEGNFVYVLKPGNGHYLAQKTLIEIGALLPEGFQVISGLKDGDIVAVAGISSLYHGRKVKLMEH